MVSEVTIDDAVFSRLSNLVSWYACEAKIPKSFRSLSETTRDLRHLQRRTELSLFFRH